MERAGAESEDFIRPKANAHLPLPCEPVDQAGDAGSTGDLATGAVVSGGTPGARPLEPSEERQHQRFAKQDERFCKAMIAAGYRQRGG